LKKQILLIGYQYFTSNYLQVNVKIGFGNTEKSLTKCRDCLNTAAPIQLKKTYMIPTGDPARPQKELYTLCKQISVK
jgi:hypothetical protein